MASRILPPGTVLKNRYRIERLIKSGGFANVYVAIDLIQNKPCAVKEMLEQTTESAEQFRLEADILANVQHSNLPAVWDYFLHETKLYLVMEYIDGDDLEGRLEVEKRLGEEFVYDWIIQLCDALTALHMHEPPIIHRDIKPANIKITPDGRAVLVDFGIAKFYRAGNHTQVAARAVTDGFSPMEQYGQGNTDARSDIYALGATLYNLLTGEIPPDAPTRVTHETLVVPSYLQPSITPLMERITLKALQSHPINRFQSAEEMKYALMEVRNQWQSGHQRTTGNLSSTGQLDSKNTWSCSICQMRNRIGSTYCSNCGKAGPALSEADMPTRIISPIQTKSPMGNGTAVAATPNGRQVAHERAWEAMVGPMGGTLLRVAGRPSQGLVACGERGLVMVYNQDAWMTLPAATSQTLYAAAIAPSHIWAVGELGTVIHFFNNHWSVLQVDGEETLTAIALDEALSGWIAGSRGSLIGLHDFAATPLPVRRGQVRSITINDVGDGWAVGDRSLILRLSQESWKARMNSPVQSDLRSIDHVNPSQAWAVGTNGLLLKMDERGWEIGPDLHLPDMNAVAFNRREEGWAVGDRGALAWYNGREWSIPASPCPIPVSLHSVAWLNDNEAWAIGEHGVVLRWRR